MRPTTDVWLQKNDLAPKRVKAARVIVTRRGRAEKTVAVIPQAVEADYTEKLWDDPAVKEIRVEHGEAEVIDGEC